MPQFLIYALADPRSSLIRYVGKSSIGLRRPRRHLSRLSRDTSHRSNWIRELVAAGLDYEIRVLEEVAARDLLDEAERRWIARGRAEGWPLTNLTDGGEGQSSPMPMETRKKISEACRRPDRVAKMSAANKGKVASDQARKNMSLSHMGYVPTLESRAKQSAARKGMKRTPETCRRISAAKIGKPRPDVAARNRTPDGREHLAKLHEMARGRPRPDLAENNRSPEKRAAASRALKGRVFSEETIARMRAGQQRRRERNRAAKEALPTGTAPA